MFNKYFININSCLKDSQNNKNKECIYKKKRKICKKLSFSLNRPLNTLDKAEERINKVR